MIDIPKHLLDIKEPFFVCSRGILKSQVEAVRKLGVEVFYSMKTNPDPLVVKELQTMGAGFSVSSPEEFLLALSAGAPLDKIIYYERGLTKERMDWLAKSGCKTFVVDSKTAFDLAVQAAPKESTIIIRIRSTVEKGPKENKYLGEYDPGVDIKTAKEMIAKCKKAGLITGVLHHDSSQTEDPASWKRKFEALLQFPDADIIDIGGGMPIGYKGECFDNVLEEIRKGVKKLNNKKIIAEPGRMIIAPACSLVAKVTLVDAENAVVNCSVYNTHIDTIIASIILPCRVVGRQGAVTKKYRILGSSLCNLDVFNHGAPLPQLSPGDTIIFDIAGAYNFASSFGSGQDMASYMVD